MNSVVSFLENISVGIRPWINRDPIYAWTSIALLIAVVPTLLLALADTRTVDGVPVWVKPLKFEISLAVFFATLVYFSGWLPESVRASTSYRLFTGSVAVCVALEMAWITSAAAYGVRSHFNVEQGTLRALYPLMGVIATYLTSSALVAGGLMLGTQSDEVPPSLREAAGWGLILTFALTVLVAWRLAGSNGLSVGGTPGGPGATFVGWRLDGRDLRLAHLIATHAVLFVVVPVALANHVAPHSWVRVTAYVACGALVLVTAGLMLRAGPRRNRLPRRTVELQVSPDVRADPSIELVDVR